MKAHEHYLEWPDLEAQLQALHHGVATNDIEQIRTVLRTCVHGYATGSDAVES